MGWASQQRHIMEAVCGGGVCMYLFRHQWNINIMRTLGTHQRLKPERVQPSPQIVVQSTQIRKTFTNGIPTPPSVWQVPFTAEVEGGDSIHPTTNLILTVAELQCTGLCRAGYQPGCCQWGVGSGYTDTTEQKLTDRGGREERKKRRIKTELKTREEGGRLHLKTDIIRVRRVEEEGGRWWGKVQNGWNRFTQDYFLIGFFSPSFIWFDCFLSFVTFFFLNHSCYNLLRVWMAPLVVSYNIWHFCGFSGSSEREKIVGHVER